MERLNDGYDECRKRGLRPNFDNCGHSAFRHWSNYQCGFKPKFDEVNGRPTRCGIHSSAAVKRREDKYQAARDLETAIRNRKDEEYMREREFRKEAQIALKKIAEGHNDPRTLAAATLAILTPL